MKPVLVVSETNRGLIAVAENGWSYWGGEPYHATALDMTERAICGAVYETLVEDDVIGADVTMDVARAIARRLRERLRGITEMPDL